MHNSFDLFLFENNNYICILNIYCTFKLCFNTYKKMLKMICHIHLCLFCHTFQLKKIIKQLHKLEFHRINIMIWSRKRDANFWWNEILVYFKGKTTQYNHFSFYKIIYLVIASNFLRVTGLIMHRNIFGFQFVHNSFI